MEKNEKVSEGISINNLHNENEEYTDFEYDDIEGVYDYNIQQNLYPPNAQNNSNNADNESQSSEYTKESTYSNTSNEINDNVEIIHEENQAQQNILDTVVEDLEGEINDLESLVESIENNIENEIDEFNTINDEIDNTIQQMDDTMDNDITPIKRNRRPPTLYEPSFKNKTYNTIDEITFVQILSKVFNQMSFKKGIKLFGQKAIDAMDKELQQMHMRNSFIPKKRSQLTQKQWSSRCEAVNLIKEKKGGIIKGRCCADGRNQRNYISREESASPTAATEAVLLTGAIEAKKGATSSPSTFQMLSFRRISKTSTNESF